MNSTRRYRLALALIAICSMTASIGSVTAAESPILLFTSKESLIDTKKNPGCGVALTSPKEKMDRNVRIIQLYFQSYADGPRDKLKYSLKSHHCMAEKSKFLFGNMTPPPAAPVEMTSSPTDKDYGAMELAVYLAEFPDIGTVPGTLKVVPWENGLSYSFNYAGTSKTTGERFVYWEAGTMLINDDGKITYFELWNDPVGLNAVSKRVFGKTYDEMPFPIYAQELEKKIKQLKPQ